MEFSFTLTKTKGHARAGIMHTPHGDVMTPMYMPVGTQASVKALDSLDLERLNAQIILANTYHLFLRPGADRVNTLGGVGEMMNWKRPMLTDSGGFQVFSLGEQMAKKNMGGLSLRPTVISNEGVEFTSHLDGTRHPFTPSRAIRIQQDLGADIMMTFDQCTSDSVPIEEAREAMKKTHAWALICKQVWDEKEHRTSQGRYQALFGIIQGGRYESLRKESAKTIVDLGFDGIAIGGETIGYNMAGTVEIMDWIRDILPKEKPHYGMGIGSDPQNIIDAIFSGYDMFDCVAPTRLARNGALYNAFLRCDNTRGCTLTSEFPKSRLLIGNSRFAVDTATIQDGCDCYTCMQGYTRAYLHHLFKVDELEYFRLASIHNVRFMIRLCEEIRRYICE